MRKVVGEAVLTPDSSARGFLQETIDPQRYQTSNRLPSECFELIVRLIPSGAQVLDVGCGSGALSWMALQNGAQHVWGIEETRVAESARKIIEHAKQNKNQKFTLLNANSHEIEIPNADLVVSELFGNDPFSEGVLPTLRDIAERCPSQTQFIPQQVEVYVESIRVTHPRLLKRLDLLSQKSNQNFTLRRH